MHPKVTETGVLVANGVGVAMCHATPTRISGTRVEDVDGTDATHAPESRVITLLTEVVLNRQRVATWAAGQHVRVRGTSLKSAKL